MRHIDIFALEQELFGVIPPNLEISKKVSKIAEKYGFNVHDTELALGLVESDPRTFAERHPEVAKKIEKNRPQVDIIAIEKEAFHKFI